MNSFYKLIASIIKEADEAFSGHATFRVADPKAVGENPIREYSLDAVPLQGEDVMVTLSLDGGEKAFEKTLSSQEANHIFSLISSDLAEAVSLTNRQEYDAAKESVKKVLKNYAERTDIPVDTNLPKLHNTQASTEKTADPEIAFERAIDHLDSKLMKGLIHQEEYDAEYAKLVKEMFPKEASLDDKLWKISKITMQNLWFSTTDELLEYQEKQKNSQSKNDQNHIPLWDVQKGDKKAPGAKDQLAPPSMSYEDVENAKEKDHDEMQKHIDETIKNKLESALQEKAASVFGPAQVELVKVLRAPGNGRNWDEIKKMFVKDFGFDKDSTNIFIDEQRESMDPTGIEVKPEEKEDVNVDVKEKSPFTPPEELVSPDTHEKLLKDHEDRKKDNSPVKEKSDTFTPKDVMDISEDEEIKDESSLDNEIARADNSDIRKVALQLWQRASNYMGDDLSDYYVGPAKGYDADALAKSNFKVALEMLGGEGNGVLVGSFGGFGGGFEQIFVQKDAKDKVAILQDIENKMKSYPVLDESDYSEQQMQEEQESYESWAKSDALRIIDEELHRQNPSLEGSVTELELSPDIEHLLASVVFSDLCYGDGTALNPKHLLQEANETGLLSGLRNKLEGKEVIPENPDQMKFFESNLKKQLIKKALKKRAAGDLNPLQEPLQEKPTTPSQDTVPMNKPLDHDAPQKGDRVFVSADLTSEKSGFEGTFISTYKSKGTDFSIVETDQGDLLDVESHRVVKTSEGSSGAQDVEPVAEPIIEMPKDDEIQVTPKMDDFHASSQKEFLTIKAEAEALLKLVKEADLDIEAESSVIMPMQYGIDDDSILQYANGSIYRNKIESGEMQDSDWQALIRETGRWMTQVGKQKVSQTFSQDADWKLDSEQINKLKSMFGVLPKASSLGTESARENSAEKCKCGHIRFDHYLKNNTQDESPDKCEGNEDSCPCKYFKKAELETEAKKEYKPCPNCGALSSSEDVCLSCLKPMKKAAADGSACIKCHKVFPLDQMVGNEHGAGYLCKADASEWNKDASLKEAGTVNWKCPKCGNSASASSVYDEKICMKDGCGTKMEKQASDFEKGISQNKTADEPEVAPKTQFKDYKIKPKYVPGTEAVPATPEMDEVLSKMEVLEQNLATLEAARKQIQAKMKEELAKIDQTGDRVGMEAELQASIEKAGILISAVESKVVSWKDKLYTMQTEEISYVPSVTPKEMLEKIYAKFSGAEAFVSSVLNGMLSQAKKVMENTLIRWPNKKSSVTKEANILDDMNHYNDELMAALKELSTPL